ncbi:MAG: hypothetical protein IVW57_15830 [Ktedonobacterales bacterium]|nr:hypothetical protein [Ktedonobacterales bacterium]
MSALDAPSATLPVSLLTVRYDAVLWSPDGRQIAVPFLAQVSSKSHAAFDGLLVFAVDGSRYHAITQPARSLEAAGPTPLAWDTQRDTAVPLASPFPGGPAALSYQWRADGTLIGTTGDAASGAWIGVSVGNAPPGTVSGANTAGPPDTSPAVDGIGNPDGDSAFSIWQPGTLAYQDQSSGGQAYAPGAYIWQASINTWSPDGRYLVTSLPVSGWLEGGGATRPPPETLAGLLLAGVPPLPVRDAATLAHDDSWSSWALAWRPDGRVLAAYGYPSILWLSDTATGRRLATFRLPYKREENHANRVLGGFATPVLWSPDGTRLMVADGDLGLVLVYEAKLLLP